MIIKIHLITYLNKVKRVVFLVILIFILSTIYLHKYFIRKTTSNYYHEPIDVVYTWVNGSDPKFLAELNSHLKGSPDSTGDASNQRFYDKYELKFSLRSLEVFAPWVRHVFIVTNGQIPYWLDLDYEKVTIVSHSEIFTDLSDLPTFSSPAIEAHIHRIPGISRRFIYFNDDIFLDSPIYLDDFVSDSRGYLIYLAWPVPMCNLDCPWLYVNDGQCDSQCFNEQCQMDGEDCNTTNKDTQSKLHKYQPSNETYTVKYLYQSQNNTITSLNQSKLDIYDSNSQPNLSKLLSNTTGNIPDLIESLNTNLLLLNKRKRKLTKSKQASLKAKSLPGDGGDNSSSSNLLQNKLNGHFDAFSESLQHTNRLYNLKYGFKPRYVAAHAPILIDVGVMTALQLTFGSSFAQTSAHKLRNGDDVQFAFSYYNFVMEERLVREAVEMFDMFDTDKSGTWSDREIRTILTKLYELPLEYAIVDHFDAMLTNCSSLKSFPEVSTPIYERYIDSKLPTISREKVINCPILMTILTELFGVVPKYRYSILKSGDNDFVAFKMLNSNISNVIGHLDHIRRKPTKFVCINDNLDPTREADNEIIISILYDFYLSLFPLPSKFELSADFRNRFLHVDELNEWRNRNATIKIIAILCICVIISFGAFKKRVFYRIVNKLFY